MEKRREIDPAYLLIAHWFKVKLPPEMTMPNPHNPSDYRHIELTERERDMLMPSWTVSVENYRELGEAIATFNHFIGDNAFIGVAQMTTEDGQTHLEINLFWNHIDVFKCEVCGNPPDNPSGLDPVICKTCGSRVCLKCWDRHEKSHWRGNTKGNPKDKVPF